MRPETPEPWLRGPLPGVHPLLTPVLQALMQAQEDLRWHTQGLPDDLVWRQVSGLAPLGFHLRHIAGSLDRLTAYLEARALRDDQLAFLREEMQPGASLDSLVDTIDQAIETASERIRSLDPTTLTDARTVGRKALPTTVIGLAIHIAEHTQRHVGQVITTCGVLRGL